MTQIPLEVISPRGPEPAEMALRVRGMYAFQALQTATKGLIVPTFGELSADGTQSLHHLSPGVWFVDLDHAVDNEEMLARAKAVKAVVVVDVHFPLYGGGQLLAIQLGETRDPGLDEAVLDRWTDLQRRRRAHAWLEVAYVVTSPRVTWAHAIHQYTATPVVVLPDMHNPREGGEFGALFVESIMRRDLSWWRRAVMAVLMGGVGKRRRRKMAAQLEGILLTGDHDWSYAKAPLP